MIGSALGDAIGEIAFRYPEQMALIQQIDHLPELIYTDDTAMAIGLAESLRRLRRIDEKDLGDTFSRNYRQEPWRGYAAGPPAIFAAVERTGISYSHAASSLFGGSGSFGNGGAMRIVPVGLFFHQSTKIYEVARASAQVTHAHPVGIDGAAVLATAVAFAVAQSPEHPLPVDMLIRIMSGACRTPGIREKMVLVRELLAENVQPEAAAQKLGRTVAVHESMPFAVYSFLRNSKSFRECLFCAVLNGGDRDTLGAMAGGLSGAYLGIDAIPEAWRQKIENRSYLEELALALAE